jgi:hypothetical protein
VVTILRGWNEKHETMPRLPHGRPPRAAPARRVVGVDVHRHRVDVDEHGARARERDDVRGRRKRVRGHEHLVARTDAEREHGHVQRGRARRHGDGMHGAGGVAEQRLELVDPRPHGEHAVLQDGGDLGELRLSEVGSS